MAVAMFLVVLTWAAAVPVLVGLGRLVQAAAGWRIRGAGDMFAAAWLGWALGVFICQLWHMFLPVGLATVVFLAALGAVGLHRAVPEMGSALRRGSGLWLAVYAVLVTSFSAWLANRSLAPLVNHDAGLYHLNSIRWAADYPLVPGLGNLHHRFCSISSHFLYLALFDSLPWVRNPSVAGPSLLLLVMVAQILYAALRAVGGKAINPDDIFLIATLPIVLRKCFENASDTTNDLPVFVGGIVVGSALCRLLLEERTLRASAHDFAVMAVLSAAVVSVKMSAVVLGFVACVAACLVLIARFRTAGNAERAGRPVFVAVLLAAVLLSSLVVRNIVLCGYPAYPSTLLGAAVPWRVPEQVLQGAARWIRSWAIDPSRRPDEVLADWGWALPWAGQVLSYWWLEVTLPLAVFVAGTGVWVVQLRRRKTSWAGVLLVAPALAALVFWFASAPDQRFAGATFWWLAAGAVSAGVAGLGSRGARAGARAVLAAAVVIAVCFHLGHEKLVDPGPDRGYYPIPVADMETFRTDSGLVLYVPAEGDQSWDSLLPSTPYPNRLLRLRRKGELRSGFLIEEAAGLWRGDPD